MSVVHCLECGREVLALHAVAYPNSVYLVDIVSTPDGYLDVNEYLETFVRLARPGRYRHRGLHVMHADTCPARLVNKTKERTK